MRMTYTPMSWWRSWLFSAVALVAALFTFQIVGVEQALGAGECPAGWTFNSGSKTCSQSWSYSGTSASWTVPSGTTSVYVYIVGAQGGVGGSDSQSGGAAGQVGVVSGTISVNPGTTIGINVGGTGTNGSTCQDHCGMGYGGTNPLGGYDGGNGAHAGCTYAQCGANRGTSGAGAGGGAASVLVVGSTHVVAAGGGGGGGGSQFVQGSAGRTGIFTAGTSGASADNNGANHPHAGVGGGGGGGASGGVAGLAAGVAQGVGTSTNADSYSAEGGSAGSNSTGSIAGLTSSFAAAQAGSIFISFTPQLAPLATTSPTVSASPVAGTSTTGVNATFAGLSGTNTLQWLVCDSSSSTSNATGSLSLPAGCRLATGTGANSLTYTPTASDVGKYLRLASTMTNSEGTYTSISATSTNPVAIPATITDLTTASDLGTSSTDNITSDNTPTLVANNLIVGASVTLTATLGSTVQTCTFIASATSQGCDLGAMVDGTWSVSSSQSSNGISSTPHVISMTIDTVPPARVPDPDLATTSDLGSSSVDNLTSDATPRIEVPGVANGVVVTVTASRSGYANVTCSYTVSASVTGCDLGTLAEGPWDVVATTNVMDTAGNPAPASSPLTVTVVSSAPAGYGPLDLLADDDSGPSATDNVTSVDTPHIDLPNTLPGSTVTITVTRAGASLLTCTFVSSSTVTGCDLPAMSDGTWTVSASVVDPSGYTYSPATMPLTIDSVAPNAPILPDLVASSDSGGSSTDNRTNDTTPKIALSGGVNGETATVIATLAGVTVQCSYVVGVSNGCDLPQLTNGAWNISGTFTDAAGNVSATSPTLIVTVDTALPGAPTVPDLDAVSDSGVSNADNITSDSTPRVSAAGGTTGNIATLTATNGSVVVSCTYVVGTATGCDLPVMADGDWSLTATFTDDLGNVSPTSPPLALVIDTTQPTGLLSPDLVPSSDLGNSNSDDLTSDSTPAVSGPSALLGQSVTMTATNGSTTVTCTYVVSATTSSCDLPVLADGTWNLTYIITDVAGNVSPTSPSHAIVVTTILPLAPNAPDLNSASDSGASSVDNLTFDSTPLIDVPKIANGTLVTVTASRPGFSNVSCTYVASSTVTGCDLGFLADGPWRVVSQVSDAAGNLSPESQPLNIVVDTVPPYRKGIGTADVAAGASSDVVLLPDLEAMSDKGGSSTDDITTESDPWVSMPTATLGEVVVMTVKRPGYADISCTYTVSATVKSCQLFGLDEGKWSLTATTTDLAGNTGTSAPIVVTVTDVVGLPMVDRSQVSTKVTNTGGTTTVSVFVPVRAGAVAVRNFVVTVVNSAGKVIRTTTMAVKRGQSSASFIMPASAGATRAFAYATNGFGVSRRALVGASVRHRRSAAVCPSATAVTYKTGNLFDRVIFDPASPVLDSKDKATLTRVAKHVLHRGGVFIISGFARRNGMDTSKFLLNLSLQRARNVSAYLSQRGVRAWIDYEGYGAVTKQIGTWRERRVDICWTEQPDPRMQ